MTIAAHFCKLMDLPPHLAISEAKGKYQDTFMYVNGKLTYVEQISDEKMVVIYNGDDGEHSVLRSNHIESLDVWLPLTGIYMIHGSPVHLWKIPKRQWKKSFSWNYYTTNHGTVDVYLLHDAIRMELFRMRDYLIYYDLVIAEFKDNEIVPTIPEFSREIELYKEHISAKV